MDEAIARIIRLRANERCEYCVLPSALSLMPFEIDHVIPRKHGGLTVQENLALSCFYCNRYKGPNIAGFDPETGDLCRWFHPRNDDWNDHFRWRSTRIVGITAIARTTIGVLRLNHPDMLLVREVLHEEGMFPF